MNAVFANNPDKIVFGYNYSQLVTYTLIAGFISKIIATNFQFQVSADIKNGGLNRFLVQPINYFSYRVFCMLGEKSIHIVFNLSLMFIVLILFNPKIDLKINTIQLVFFGIAMTLALFLNFLIFFCISTLAFWFDDVQHVFGVVGIMVSIVSGGIFPLDVFGGTIEEFLKALPFSYTTYFSINILNGKLVYENIIQGLYFQTFWIACFLVLSLLLWKRGTKRYILAGG